MSTLTAIPLYLVYAGENFSNFIVLTEEELDKLQIYNPKGATNIRLKNIKHSILTYLVDYLRHPEKNVEDMILNYNITYKNEVKKWAIALEFSDLAEACTFASLQRDDYHHNKFSAYLAYDDFLDYNLEKGDKVALISDYTDRGIITNVIRNIFDTELDFFREANTIPKGAILTIENYSFRTVYATYNNVNFGIDISYLTLLD